MSTNCLHCGSPLHSLRSTKKYCSDNCKQLAFYKRNALLQGDEQTQGVRLPIDAQSDPVIGNHQLNSESQLSPVGALTEEPYQHLFSTFIGEIEFHLDNGEAFGKFKNLEKFWSSSSAEAAKWISVRLRCLIENLIRLSHLPSITHQTLRILLKAFREILASDWFQKLPSNYPYSPLIMRLETKLSILVKQGKQYQTTKFRLSSNRKAELIAVRFILAGIVPLRKFTELNFKK